MSLPPSEEASFYPVAIDVADEPQQVADLQIETPTGSWFIYKFSEDFEHYAEGLPGIVFRVVSLLALVKDNGPELYNYHSTVMSRI